MRQLLRWICALACSLSLLLASGPQTSWAQEFTPPGAGEGGETPPPVTPPVSGKPVVLTIFYPADATSEKILEVLNDTLVEHIEGLEVDNGSGQLEKPLSAINGVAMLLQLDALEPAERDACINDPACIADNASMFDATKVVVGRIYTEGRDRPEISLQLFDVSTKAIDNVFTFESNKNLKRQQKELRPALYKLFKYKVPTKKTTQLGSECTADLECQQPFNENLICGGDEEVAKKICVIPPKELFTTGQIIGSTSAGVVGLGLIATGVVFGLGASDLETNVKDSIKTNSITQVDAQADLDSASTKATIANVFYGVGALSLVGAVVILLLPNDEEDQALRQGGEGGEPSPDSTSQIDFFLQPAIGAEGGGLLGGFRF